MEKVKSKARVDLAQKLNKDFDKLGEAIKKRNLALRLTEKDRKRVYSFNNSV